MEILFQAPPIGFEPMGYKVPSRSQGECLRPDSTTMALEIYIGKGLSPLLNRR